MRIDLVFTQVGGAKALIVIYIIILTISSYHIIKARISFSRFNRFLNIMSIFLISIPSFEIIKNLDLLEKSNGNNIKIFQRKMNCKNLLLNTQNPDIYYIILDMYAGQRCLSNYYQYDNSEFIEELENRGLHS